MEECWPGPSYRSFMKKVPHLARGLISLSKIKRLWPACKKIAQAWLGKRYRAGVSIRHFTVASMKNQFCLFVIGPRCVVFIPPFSPHC